METQTHLIKKRGGKQPGAGRPKKEPTKLVRVPLSCIDKILEIIKSHKAS
jgi:hypothetical protein